MIRRHSAGRGRAYTPGRGIFESVLRVLYAGAWPARLWRFVSGPPSVRPVSHRLLASGNVPSCRIAFVSDLHIGPVTHPDVLERAAAEIRNARPDVLILGGDYVFLDATDAVLRQLRDWLSAIPVPVKLAVMGNHDLWTEDAKIVAALKSAGAAVLVNECVRLPSPYDGIVVIGLDDPWTGSIDADMAFAGTGDAVVRIVVCHQPDGLLHCAEREFDIFLCGHVHGGQVAMPWGPIVVSYGRLSRALSSGFHTHRDRAVYVSRGIGCVDVPVRLFAQPDILVLDVSSTQAG